MLGKWTLIPIIRCIICMEDDPLFLRIHTTQRCYTCSCTVKNLSKTQCPFENMGRMFAVHINNSLEIDIAYCTRCNYLNGMQGSAQNDLSAVVKMALYCIEYSILVLLFSLSGGKNRLL